MDHDAVEAAEGIERTTQVFGGPLRRRDGQLLRGLGTRSIDVAEVMNILRADRLLQLPAEKDSCMVLVPVKRVALKPPKR